MGAYDIVLHSARPPPCCCLYRSFFSFPFLSYSFLLVFFFSSLPNCTTPAPSQDSDLACRAACAASSKCNSYTWTPGPRSDSAKCNYTHNCWLRDDTVWVLKDSERCLGMSGYKGTPPPQPGPSPSPSPSPPPSPPPSPAPAGALNVLFVIFDDLRVMHKPWGFNQTHTPNTDAFAAKSLAFDNAYCNQAVCGPSRASLISGRRPDTTQMWNFDGSFRDTKGAAAWNTWPQWFKKHGCGRQLALTRGHWLCRVVHRTRLYILVNHGRSAHPISVLSR